jgi:hypothetical protein
VSKQPTKRGTFFFALSSRHMPWLRGEQRLRMHLALLLLLTALLLSGGCAITLPLGCPPDCLGVNLSQRDLTGVDLHGAILRKAFLGRSDLGGANLQGRCWMMLT